MTVLVGSAQSVVLYGQNYNSFFVGSNGYLTFTQFDTDYTENLPDHFRTARISVLFDDLNPSLSGQVSWQQLPDRVVVTWEAVPEPKVVIASGACAISGGPFYGSEDIVGDLNRLIPVDLYIPGCPPHPLTTLHALLQFFK